MAFLANNLAYTRVFFFLQVGVLRHIVRGINSRTDASTAGTCIFSVIREVQFFTHTNTKIS